MLRATLQVVSALVILAGGGIAVAWLPDAFGLDWDHLSVRSANEGLAPAPWVIGALALAIASGCFFLWEQLWRRNRGLGSTPPALYFGILSILVLELGLLFAAETVYEYLFRTFK